MSCHEGNPDEHCVGWIHNQAGAGNNVLLRVRLSRCENFGSIRLRGEQHESFADTLPAAAPLGGESAGTARNPVRDTGLAGGESPVLGTPPPPSQLWQTNERLKQAIAHARLDPTDPALRAEIRDALNVRRDQRGWEMPPAEQARRARHYSSQLQTYGRVEVPYVEAPRPAGGVDSYRVG